MILLIVDEDKEMISKIVEILRKGGGVHEVHTASGFETAEKAAAAMKHIDVLITESFTADGSDGFSFRDRLRERFPALKTAFVNAYDLSDYAEQIGPDPVFERPPDERELLKWAAAAGVSTAHATTPVPVVEDSESGDDDEEVMVAETVHAPRRQLGDYMLLRLIGTSPKTEAHEAVQQSIDRRVSLVLLKPEFTAEHEELREFRGSVRAKAAVTHPHIVPVYEGFEEEGAIFYTRELVDGQNIVQLAEAGKKLRGRTIYGIVKTVAEAMLYLESRGIHYEDLEPRHIFLGSDGNTRVSNIASLEPSATQTTGQHIRNLGLALQPLLNTANRRNDILGQLLGIMAKQEIEVSSWEELSYLIQGIDERLSAEESRNPPSRPLLAESKGPRRWVAAAVILALAGGAIVASIPFLKKPKARDFENMIWISGGEFLYQGGEAVHLDSFWIDEHEVSIGQYAKFLEALEVGRADRYDHSDQAEKAPDKKDHVPDEWDEYYSAAVDGRRFRGEPIDVNCPVMLVDWWDAYAYAKWKGRRLPTEVEWEKAARGAEGNAFPWGSEMDYSKLNSAEKDDGYAYWAPVDAFAQDRSPAGVIGMGGNVSEWTDTQVDHPEIPDTQLPVARGGSFATKTDDPSNYELSNRSRIYEATARRIFLGFRTVSDKDPNA